jgi:hypothetical protein
LVAVAVALVLPQEDFVDAVEQVPPQVPQQEALAAVEQDAFSAEQLDFASGAFA